MEIFNTFYYVKYSIAMSVDIKPYEKIFICIQIVDNRH